MKQLRLMSGGAAQGLVGALKAGFEPDIAFVARDVLAVGAIVLLPHRGPLTADRAVPGGRLADAVRRGHVRRAGALAVADTAGLERRARRAAVRILDRTERGTIDLHVQPRLAARVTRGADGRARRRQARQPQRPRLRQDSKSSSHHSRFRQLS